MNERSIVPLAAATSVRARSPWPLATVLALAASASGIFLTGLSVWFLSAVALAGLGPVALAFNFHTPAAFVRLLALSKTLAKYGERIVGHRAALLDQVKRRAGLFMAMARAPATRAASWQLGNQDRLSDYMEDVEDVDYAGLRVGMPVAVLVAGFALLAGATAWLAPLALVPIVLLSVAVAATLRLLIPGLGRCWAIVRSSQRTAGRLLGEALASVVPLQAERAFSGTLSSLSLLISTMRKPDDLLNVMHLPGSTCLPVLSGPWRLSASWPRRGRPEPAAVRFSLPAFSGLAGSPLARPHIASRVSCWEKYASAPPAKVSRIGPP